MISFFEKLLLNRCMTFKWNLEIFFGTIVTYFSAHDSSALNCWFIDLMAISPFSIFPGGIIEIIEQENKYKSFNPFISFSASIKTQITIFLNSLEKITKIKKVLEANTKEKKYQRIINIMQN
jgi:hypothetical protein